MLFLGMISVGLWDEFQFSRRNSDLNKDPPISMAHPLSYKNLEDGGPAHFWHFKISNHLSKVCLMEYCMRAVKDYC